MALIVASTLAANVASTALDFVDTTGVSSTGYGGSNRPTSANIVTEYTFTLPDLSTVLIDEDAATLPITDWTPKNALLRSFTLAQLGLTSTTLPYGVIQCQYVPWFQTASNGTVNVVNGSTTVTRNSGQTLTSDFSDSFKVRIAGVNYTIATGGIAATTLTLTTAYAGVTATGVTAYIGYQSTSAAIISYDFLLCWQPAWTALDLVNCSCTNPKYLTLSKLYDRFVQVQAMWTLGTTGGFANANLAMVDVTDACTCYQTTGGCC